MASTSEVGEIDIFLSYRNLPLIRTRIGRLAAILAGHGYKVWWDFGLEAGVPFQEQIFRAIERSKIVMPVWCSQSIASDWVLMEARLGESKLPLSLLLLCV